MRQLDLHPRRKLRNSARHLRSLEKWSRSFRGFFPAPEDSYKGLWYIKIPIFEKVVVPPHTTPEIQRRCIQLLIDGAERLRAARPVEHKEAKIYASFSYPDLFSSFVEVAFEPNPHLFFNLPDKYNRKGDDAFWHEFFEIDDASFREIDLRIPEGFDILCAGLRVYDSSEMSKPVESQEWVVGETV